MTNSEDFFSVQTIFTQKVWMYFKENGAAHRKKGPLLGRFDSFQIVPDLFRCKFLLPSIESATGSLLSLDHLS